VLLDVQMPRLDGFSVCEWIRARPGAEATPVVMMTGLDDVESIRRAYEVRATDFVTKPLHWLILSHRVRYLLRASENLAELRRSQERLASAQRIGRMGSWELDPETLGVEGSEEFCAILGLAPEGKPIPARTLLERVHPDDRPGLEATARAALEAGAPLCLDARALLPDGSERILHCEARVVSGAEGRSRRVEGTIQDVTERKRAEEQIRLLAYHDTLTGLGNRLLFRERLDVAVAQARRAGSQLGILFLDLDHFKRINDTLGHEVGDLLLRDVSKRISSVLRKGDTLSRLGGDEFVVVLESLKTPEDAGNVARKVIEVVSQPYDLHGNTLNTAASVGIAVYPADGNDATTLMRHADTAMYVAKSSGRKNHQFFSADMNIRATERLRLEAALRGAVDRSELRVFYQPRVDIASETLTGAEALLRWQHPDHGLLPAGRFLPLIEETGLIHTIGEWVLASACEQAHAWHALDQAAFAISVNVSHKQFNRALLGRVRGVLDASGLDPRMLELELTEAALARSPEEARAVLAGLRNLGVRVVVDDFGTGYSSMSQLRRFAIDGIKIDRSFIRGMMVNPDDRVVVKAMIDMARSLRINTIAEGVETPAELDLLRTMGCEEYSGHVLAEPGTVTEFERRWLRAGNVLALRPRR
jgi:diguanylate cyclase (GGDEF)-like protein/PAS domain S-box-containing protein